MDGSVPGGTMEERRKLLEEWCVKAVKVEYVHCFDAGVDSAEQQPGSGEKAHADCEEQTDRPIALRKGKRKAHSVEDEDLVPLGMLGSLTGSDCQPVSKKQNCNVVDDYLPLPENWQEELEEWFESVAAQCDTSDSTDADSLLGDDIKLLDVPETDSGEDSDPAMASQADFGWARSYRKWKRPLIYYPNLAAYEKAVKSIEKVARPPAGALPLRKSVAPEAGIEAIPNCFIGAFNQYCESTWTSPATEPVSLYHQLERSRPSKTQAPRKVETEKYPINEIAAQIMNGTVRAKSSFVN